MNTRRLRHSLVTVITGMVLINPVQASTPVWTFEPVAGYPTSVSVSPSETATIKYIVTNQSHKLHTLKTKPVQGITASGCVSSLSYHQSCTLTLTIAGNDLKGDVQGGPVLCEQSNPNQCYQPGPTDQLAIRLMQTPPVQQYTVTSSADSNGSISPDGSQTVNAGASLTFTATPASGYGVNQWLVDGTLVQTGGATWQLTNIAANHTVNVTFGTVTLTPSTSTLGLSVNCPAASTSLDCAQKNNALTGVARQITITNHGSADATNVAISSSGLPSDASVSPSSCGTVAANGGTCVITVTPGAIASSNASNVLCTAGVQPEGSVNVTADGGPSTSVTTYILGYGCIYQGGFVYSVDDTTANTGSIAGKTAAITDTYPGQTVPSQTTPDWGGYGTDIGPALHADNVQGANDGSANSAAIISTLTPPLALSDYAAGLCSTLSVDDAGAPSCTAPNVCYTNWYLPAICEIGPFSAINICTAGSTNIQQQLFESVLNPAVTFGLVNTGYYWSSTEAASSSDFFAYYERFVSGGSSTQNATVKNFRLGVRCSRAFIP